MPDIGLTELMVIGLVLFLIVGPERFPEFFGQVAGMIRKARQWINETRQMVKQEGDALQEPLVQAHDQIQDEIRRASENVRDGLGEQIDELRRTGQSLKEGQLPDVLMGKDLAGEETGETKNGDDGKASGQSHKKSDGLA